MLGIGMRLSMSLVLTGGVLLQGENLATGSLEMSTSGKLQGVLSQCGLEGTEIYSVVVSSRRTR